LEQGSSFVVGVAVNAAPNRNQGGEHTRIVFGLDGIVQRFRRGVCLVE
jgi:hypothetical protein